MPIGKSNLLLDLQKKQKNHVFLISVDILQNTNFISAFALSTDVPAIYIQQFWHTLTKDNKSGVYSFQLDEQWFTLNADLLRNALGITPRDPAHPFVAPLNNDVVIDFVNELGYLEELQFISKMVVNSLYQPWRTILTLINQDYAELIWEEFTQVIKTFFSDAAAQRDPSKKVKTHVIPYCHFTKLIICYLGGRYNIHQWTQSPLHITSDDNVLGYLKFVPKGEKDEVFRMDVLNELITHKTATAEEGVKKKAPPAAKPKKPAPVKKPTPAQKKSAKRGIQMSLDSFEAQIQGQRAPRGRVSIREPTSGITRTLIVVKGKGKGIATDELAAKSLLEFHGDTEILRVEDVQGDELKSHTVALNEGQTRSDSRRRPGVLAGSDLES
ncbi:hypothetical protein Tco_1384823 [Tanacetum coccineum]